MRDLRGGSYGLDRADIANEIGQAALDELEREGYLEPSGYKDFVTTTVKGNALGNAKFGKPVGRAKAEAELRAFLDRVRAVNARSEHRPRR